MRVLYYVPIIHTVEDYGSLGPAIKEAFDKRAGGETAFAQLQKNINNYWEMVEKWLEKMIPDARNFIIYQDSFPTCSREKILTHFRHLRSDNLKSPNIQLLQKLLNKGAVLEGTEDMNPVIEQAQLYQCVVAAASVEEQEKIFAAQTIRSQEIMRLRDVFIAQRIHDTLPKSKKGILFIGWDHDVITELKKLPRKFTVVYP